MDGKNFIKLNYPQQSNTSITFIGFPDQLSEISISRLEKIKIKDKFSPNEIDLLIREVIKDFSNNNLDIIVISSRILNELNSDSIDMKNYLKKQDLIRENIVIPFIDEDQSLSILFVKDFISLFNDNFLDSINKTKINNKMKYFFIHNNNNPELIMNNFKKSIELLKMLIETYLNIIFDSQIINGIYKIILFQELDYKFININSLFNDGNMPEIYEIFKNNEIIEIVRELSQRFNTIKNLKIDNLIQQKRDVLIKENLVKKEKHHKNLQFKINRSMSPKLKFKKNFNLTPINKALDQDKIKELCPNLEKNDKLNSIKSIRIKRNRNFKSPLSSNECKEFKNNIAFENTCTKPLVDEYNFEYLNTEESLNQNKDQIFSFKLKKEIANQTIKEEILETNNLQESKEKSYDFKDNILNKVNELKFPSEVKYDFVEDHSQHSLSSDMEEITVNRQLNQSVIDNKPILEIKKAATFNFSSSNPEKKREFPYHLDEEDLFFNNLDLIEDYVRKNRSRKSHLIKKRKSKESKELKAAKNDNYFFNLKGRLNPSSLLDCHIKKEFGLTNIRKGKNMIRYNTYRYLYDLERNDEEKRCLAYANSKCRLF